MFAVLSLHAQVRKIPAEVTDAFKERYPHAEKVAWKDQITSFEAEFVLNDYDMTADFNSSGDWLQSEKKIKYEELPAGVKDGFSKSKYSDWEKGNSFFEINKSSEAPQYRIYVKKGAVVKKYLYFNSDGRLERESLTL